MGLMNAVDKLIGIVDKSLGYLFVPGMTTRQLKAQSRGEVKAELEKVKGVGLLGNEYSILGI